ncbi:amino acid ABC transporter permease [Paracraurococcus lichenis]|uniref:Amino acid ABC transporter permease n=1 Tax=Paracraurococcus lichenis TaxID=3064888 RepID=A0ABT9DU73_9PROT|nr:amino acid ABC transporter permease [Paracraurococcus sp. LOR1-02]MDO9707444.1 amino acid ABC transporter permease [Paracraurococcus sp. LOR1-02]
MMWQDLVENFADWPSLVKVWPLLAQGLLVTAELSLVALPLGLAAGLAIGIGCALGGRALRIALLCWIDLFRAFPLLVLLILITYALPFLGLTLPTFAAAVLALVLNNSGYYGEIFRAGLASVPHGQREAAAALGLPPLKAMLLVVLPQALRGVLAPLASNSLELVKGTSVAAMVSLPELLRSARVAQEQTYNPTPLMAAAALYFLLLWPFAHLVARLERRMLRGRAR